MSQESSEKVDADSSVGSNKNIISASNIEESDFIELSDIVPAEHKVYIPQLLEEIQDDILLGQDLIDAATNKSIAEIPESAARSRELHINNTSNSSDMILQQPVDSTILQAEVPVIPNEKRRRRGRPPKSAQNCSETSSLNVSNDKSKGKRGRWTRNSSINKNEVRMSTRKQRCVQDVTNNSSHDMMSPDSVVNDVQNIISSDVYNEDIKITESDKLSTLKNITETDVTNFEDSILACCVEKKSLPKKIEKKNKVSRKRKRSFKKGKAELESVNIGITETTVDENEDKDEEDDNIILSKIKNNTLSASDSGDMDTPNYLNVKKKDQSLPIDTPIKDIPIDDIHVEDKPIVDTSLFLDISPNTSDRKETKKINDFEPIIDIPTENKPTDDVLAEDVPKDQPLKDKSVEDSSLLLEVSSKSRGRKKKKLMTDFEYDIDGVIARNMEQEQPLLSEDGRPLRRKARQKHYEEESDEDPFANIETDSENDDNRKSKYYSDGEYVPGNLRKSTSASELEDLDEDLEEEYPKRKRSPKKQDSRRNKSTKASKNVDGPTVRTVTADSILIDDDIENCIQTSIIELKNKMIGTSLQIKKVSSQDSNKSTPLDIPMIDTTIVKNVDMSTQTTKIETLPACVQTSAPYNLKIKETVSFSKEQSENACVFISNVLNATSELGVLMQQKSNEFIEKKINTTCIKDNTKVDYCIKKAYLLFKLAKDNLTNMEESLGKQYEQFLQSNNLMSSYITESKITPSVPKPSGSDSDCEIVEVPIVEKKAKNSQKTVILNKELSIKIAKKTPAENPRPTNNKQKINLKGAHSVWINESIKIKKVKPQQSFLAQDSRYKKPPDQIFEDIVKNFFYNNIYLKEYYCAPFTSPEWLSYGRDIGTTCNYFFVEKVSKKNCDAGETYSDNNGFFDNVVSVDIVSDEINQNCHFVGSSSINMEQSGPQQPTTLSTMCINVLNKKMLRIHNFDEDKFYNGDECRENPKSLVRLCLNYIMINSSIKSNLDNLELNMFNNKDVTFQNQMPLKCINGKTDCYKNSINEENNLNVIHDKNEDLNLENHLHTSPKSLIQICLNHISLTCNIMSSEIDSDSELSDGQSICDFENYISMPPQNAIASIVNKIDALSLLCSRTLQNEHLETFSGELFPKSLSSIACNKIISLMYPENIQSYFSCPYKINSLFTTAFNVILKKMYSENKVVNDGLSMVNIEIDNVNTITQEAFSDGFNLIENPSVNTEMFYEQTLSNDENFSDDYEDNYLDENQSGGQWFSERGINDDKSCLIPIIQNVVSTSHEKNLSEVNTEIETEMNTEINSEVHTEIDTETITDTTNNTDMILRVKQELFEESLHHTDNNKVSVSVKPEPTFSNDITIKQELNAFGLQYTDHNNSEMLDSFDKFIIHNPVARGLITGSNCPIYSQSDLRVRRQYEPDSDNEFEFVPDMDLLIPQASDSHLVEKAKNILMEESGDEHEIVQDKRKSIPKRRGRPRKGNEVLDNRKNLKMYTNSTKNKPVEDKINNEEKKIESSNSELITNNKLLSTINDSLRPTRTSRSKNDIQCSEVDSTQNDITNRNEEVIKNMTKSFNLKDKLKDDNSQLSIQNFPPVVDVPIELLECEPLMPVFDNDEQQTDDAALNRKELNAHYKEKDGWQCYKFNTDDIKLYSVCEIPLEKLPDTFVGTYMRYTQNDSDSDNDPEIERLTNLLSLNKQRRTVKEKSSGKVIDGSNKDNKTPPGMEKQRIPIANDDDGKDHDYDNYDELEPSDDDHPLDDLPAPTNQPALTENAFAKNLLMGENDSDDEDKMILQKPMVKIERGSKKFLAGPKSKKLKYQVPEEGIVLTADRMMKKELELLHAPVVMKEEVDDKVEIKISPDSKPRRSRTSRRGHKSGKKGSDDSSSEEEKLWVSTKTKLLKQVEKKVMERSVDDARRAKLIKEFIERRDNLATELKRLPRGRKGRRMSRQLMEREKQLRVLSYELFGEDGNKHALPGKKSQGNCYKGRRNIRKVLDKKSLARSTVLANMEEFERKRRLNFTQNRLRELLGIEEGVSVAVIDNELCLEYDFEDLMPAVTVHPFFTKVMKAHQCEGVKFLWDACFESLQTMESGHPGGGCILAHCMGLGKTLQVLALLHTVLTNPRTGIKRVLVCCPLSTVLNWVDEIHKWLGPVTNQIRVFELSKLKKTYERAYQLEDWYNEGGIFIIGYELFRSLSTIDSLLDNVRPTIVAKIRAALLDPGPDIIVCDEGHLLKNDCSVLAIAMSRVKTKRRIMLTGTPMQNNLREYYCMVNFVKPNLLGTYSEYSNRFENPIMNGQHRDSSEADIKLMKARTHILHKVLEGCLQRQEASVLYPYLPTKHEYTVFIGLTKCQSELYKHYIEKFAGRSKQNILKDFHTLQKIWSHPRVLHNFLVRCKESDANKPAVKAEKAEDDLATEDLAIEDVKPSDADAQLWLTEHLAAGDVQDAIESSNKFVTVFKILDECIQANDKLLLFSTSLYTMDALEYFLKKINKWSLGQEYYRLDGSVRPEIRQNWCRGFNAENNTKTKLFLISTRAGSLGLNLTAANRVILMDTSWNPAHDIQSIFRVYRFGQKKDCFIYRLVALGTMEQKIYERSVTKQAVACRVVDEQQIDRHYNMAELSELYRFDELGEGVAGGVALGVRDVALLRVARDTPAVHAVHEHDSLLRDTSEQQLPEHERAAAWDQFQQEQATKQMQNERTKLKSQGPLKRSFPIPDSDAVPLKVYAGTSGIQQPTIKTELPVIEMCESVPSKRTRRGRPTSRVNIPVVDNANIPIPIDNSTSTIEDVLQTHLYNNIIDALLLQRFFRSEEEIITSNMGTIIKNIIASDRLNNKSEVEIYNRVVNNLISSVKPSTSKETVVETISDDLIVPKQEIDIDISETPTNTDDVILSNTQVMPRRKPKQEVGIEATETLTNTKTKDMPRKKDKKSKKKSKKSASKDNEDVVVVLSDDDEDDFVPLASVTAKNKNENSKITLKPYSQLRANILEKDIAVSPEVNEVVKTEASGESADDEQVPLHPDILLKPCFTKIVAHIFQKRNPDLNDASALLAAEYSVKSALDDITKHNKKLCTGTIYDIATQIIGKNILKQLWDSYNEADESPNDVSNTKVSTDTPSTVKKEVESNGMVEEVMTNEVNQLKWGVNSSINKRSVIRSNLPPNELVKTLRRIAPTTKKDILEPAKQPPIKLNRETTASVYTKMNNRIRIVPTERVDSKTGTSHYVIVPNRDTVIDNPIFTTTVKDNKIVIIPRNIKNNEVRPVMTVNSSTGKKYVCMPPQRTDHPVGQPAILPHVQPSILAQQSILPHVANVVPVKLIRRSDFPEVREEESILPDGDDDVRITSSPGPSVVTQPIVPSVFPDLQEQIILNATTKSKNANVISLDSDDEAVPAPQKTVVQQTAPQSKTFIPTPPHILKRNSAIKSQKQATPPLTKSDLSANDIPVPPIKKTKGKSANKPQKQKTPPIILQPDQYSTPTRLPAVETPPPSNTVETKKVARKSTTTTLPRLAPKPATPNPPVVKEKTYSNKKTAVVKNKASASTKITAVKEKASTSKENTSTSQKIIDLYSDDDTQSSTSDDGKLAAPPEPHDPLDIFKNVVHIQAPVCDYESPKEPVKKQTNIKVQPINQSKPTQNTIKQSPNIIKNSTKPSPSTAKTAAKQTPTKSPATTNTKITKKNGKAPADCKLLGSIDLTDEQPPANWRTYTKKLSTSSGGASTSKPNIQQKVKAASISVQQTKPSAPQKAKSGTSNVQTNKSVAPNLPMKVKQPAPVQKAKSVLVTPKVEVTAKRKLAAPDTSAVKKKRPEPMTLADFTLDDLEDIIELE